MVKKFLTASVFLLALMAFINSDAKSQSIYFCEGVDDDGYAITPSSEFTISRDGGYLYVLVRMGGYDLGSYSAKYVIYRNGEYDNTIYQDTEPNWDWFWQKITFYKSGDYDIYVYDGGDNLLTSGYLRINFR